MGGSDLVFALSPTQKAFVLSNAEIAHLIGPMGEGKCNKRGTKILMFDGRIKCVEDVAVGDQLMGDDSTPRNVLSLGHGFGDLFRIVPIQGDSWACNADHILSLRRTPEQLFKRGKPVRNTHRGEINDISVKDFMSRPANYRAVRKLYRVPAEFPPQPTTIDPYFLGVWLGDGNAHNTGITTPDEEITRFIYRYAALLSMDVRVNHLMDNKSDTYTITNHCSDNPLLRQMQALNLIKNKHIPLNYLANSREIRLRLLAGLADSDGYVNRTSYQFVFKQKQLAEDVAYLCRSLGFAAYVSTVKKSIKDIQFTGTYYQVGVSGDLSIVPATIPRKRCPPRRQIKDVLMTGIKEIIPEGPGEYFGFNLDGNHRFLLGDFTVTHNTFAGIAGCIWHAKRCGKPIRGALIRDTHVNIKTSTATSIRDILKERGIFKDNYKKLYIKCTPSVELDLFGIDDQASISKLQGPEYAIIWLEEPAPIYEKANAGLPKEVFDIACARAARQQGTKPRVQITHNPADEGHWTNELAEAPAEYLSVEIDGQMVVVHKDTFHIPKGENRFLTPMARAMLMAAFKNDPAKWARYIEGKSADVHEGEAVIPGYDPKVNFSQTILPVYPNIEGFRGWDGDQHPSCITAQYNPAGQLVIHDVLTGEGIGPKELIEEKLLLLLSSGKYKDRIPSWRDIGDPSMCDPDRSTNKTTAARTIAGLLKTRFERGPTRWLMRKDPTNYAVKRRLNEGKPAIVISASAFLLHQALKGGWHFKKDNSGNVIGKKPVKNSHDHVGNSFAYLISILMPYDIRKEVKEIDKMIRMNRALSYGGGWHKPQTAAMGVR